MKKLKENRPWEGSTHDPSFQMQEFNQLSHYDLAKIFYNFYTYDEIVSSLQKKIGPSLRPSFNGTPSTKFGKWYTKFGVTLFIYTTCYTEVKR